MRVAIYLAPAAGAGSVRLLKWAEGPGVSTGNTLWQRLNDPSESDADLTAALSAERGTLSEVATYTGNFEARRLQVSWTQDSFAVGGDDVRVATFHLLKLTAGAPDATWVAADFTAVINAFDTFWTGIKSRFATGTKLKRLAFYKAGPAIAPPQPPVNAVDRDVAGTSVYGPCPPQVAITVTERAGSKPNWGRFYLPAPDTGMVTGGGRILTAASTQMADAADTFYEACKTAGTPVVVYRPSLAVRPRKDPTLPNLPARPANAQTVEQIAIDDIYDVIRSRRWNIPLLRTVRDITQP